MLEVRLVESFRLPFVRPAAIIGAGDNPGGGGHFLLPPSPRQWCSAETPANAGLIVYRENDPV